MAKLFVGKVLFQSHVLHVLLLGLPAIPQLMDYTTDGA